MRIDKKTVVAHFDYPVFLPKSETFVYQYISHLTHFHPVCLSWGFDNLDQFPVPDQDSCLLALKKYTLKWLYNGLERRLLYQIQKGFFRRDRAAERIATDFLKSRNAKLIHAHFGTTGVLTCRLKKILDIPHITTFYGFDVSRLATKKKWKEQYIKLFQEGDMFLVEGLHMKSELVALGCPVEKIEIQRIAIPAGKIPFRTRQPKKNSGKAIFIFGGRFIEKKGLIYALKALKKVRENYSNFEFRIIGDGPLRNEITSFIMENGMEEYVLLLGFLSYPDYMKQMQEADIFIHPSITAADGDSEGGAPTTILEAQAMGMPVISSYHADIPNIVIPGESALLSEEKDWKALAENIRYLLDNQSEWEAMGKTGRNLIENRHNITVEVYSLENKYSKLIQANGSRA
jgi:colanic acid/amylovoran biosynthesis glycosyltransferase